MARNLIQKISLLLEDIETLQKAEAIRRIENLVNEELNFLKSEHIITSKDLTLIRGKAIDGYLVKSVSHELGNNYIITDMDLVRTLCYVYSISGFLKLQGLINFDLKFKRK